MNEKKVNKKKVLLIGGTIGTGVVVGAGVAIYLHKKNMLRVLKDMVVITNKTNDWLLMWKPTDYGKDVDLKVIIEQLSKHKM